MPLDLVIPPVPARTGPLPRDLARIIRSILTAPDGDASATLALADALDGMAAHHASAFGATPAELRRGAHVLRELTQAAGPTGPLSAIEADRRARR